MQDLNVQACLGNKEEMQDLKVWSWCENQVDETCEPKSTNKFDEMGASDDADTST